MAVFMTRLLSMMRITNVLPTRFAARITTNAVVKAICAALESVNIIVILLCWPGTNEKASLAKEGSPRFGGDYLMSSFVSVNVLTSILRKKSSKLKTAAKEIYKFCN